MTTIHAQAVGEQIILSKEHWERLLGVAQRTEPISVEYTEDELMRFCKATRLSAFGSAFDFWFDEGEDIYTLEDGEPV